MKFFFLFLLAFNAQAYEGTWEGFEIVGQRTIARAAIAREIPIRIGDKYVEDRLGWQKICAALKRKFDLHYAHCEMVGYVDAKAYFVVDLVEKGDEARTQFRPAPEKTIALADAEVNALYDRLYARLWDLFNRGITATENTAKGYLDYDDAAMNEITRELSLKTPPYRANLLAVLANAKDPESRRRAANLLNWDLQPAADISRAVRLLDDPDSGVRNNISRFALKFVGEVMNFEDQKSLVDAFTTQLERPTHGDRNKALYAILNLVRAFPHAARLT